MGDFYDVTVGPDGTPRGAFVDSCPGPKNECTSFGVTDPRGEAIMGQLVGGPPLVGTIAQQIEIGPHVVITDAGRDVGGDDLGPDPHELLDAALAACTALTTF